VEYGFYSTFYVSRVIAELLFQLDGNDPLHAAIDQECFDNLYYTVK